MYRRRQRWYTKTSLRRDEEEKEVQAVREVRGNDAATGCIYPCREWGFYSAKKSDGESVAARERKSIGGEATGLDRRRLRSRGRIVRRVAELVHPRCAVTARKQESLGKCTAAQIDSTSLLSTVRHENLHFY